MQSLTPAQKSSLLSSLTDDEAEVLIYEWERWARPNQLPPPGDWIGWLVLAGRGFGKTRLGLEFVRANIESGNAGRIALIAETAADGRDVLVEGESGLLAISPPWNRPVYESSKRRVTWPNGAIATLYDAREPDQLRGPQHDLCLTASAMISTPSGRVPIASLRVDDLVHTTRGPRRVEATGSRLADVGIVWFSNGQALCGTRDHPINTSHSWTNLSELRSGDLCATDALSTAAGVGTRIPVDTWNTGELAPLSARIATGFTARCGRTIAARFRRATKFITGTKTFSTTMSTTWSVCQRASIAAFTSHLSQSLGLIGQTSGLMPSSALTAVAASSGSCERRRLFAQPAISRQPEPGRSATKPSGPVSVAGRASFHSLGAFAVSVVSTWVGAGRQRVYSLQVEGEEYFANGILVHNCLLDELAKYRYAQAVWDNLLPGLRLGVHPRWVATTTPRPIQLIKALVRDPHVVVTKGRSLENLANLAKTFKASVIDKYAGTRLGRQELDAEILEDVPGALWVRRNLDEYRVDKCPPLKRVVVGVDPAATGNEGANETGIVVCGIDANNHGYVIEDWSLHGHPDVWARRAVAAYRKHECDRIVAEVNQGGDMVSYTIKTIEPNVPITTVHASRGKYVRAEPIAALYEQGKIHHVGALSDLEDQMTAFTPESAAADRTDGKSPDRVDALVWAFTHLFPSMTERIARKVVTPPPTQRGPQGWLGR